MKKSSKITLLSTLSIFSVSCIHFLNKLIFISATSGEKLYSDHGNIYNWRFGKIFYTKAGSGTPLLLIHDLSSTSSDYEWKKVVSELSKDHTVYTIDLLGCGRSEKPKMIYTNYLYVQLILDFIKNVVKQKTDIIVSGKSIAIVTLACYIESTLFNKLIFVNPEKLTTMNHYPRYRQKLYRYIIDSPILGTTIYNFIVRKSAIKKDFKTNYYYNKNKILKKDIQVYHEASHLGGSSAKYLHASIQGYYTNANILHALKEINNSIYIISGTELETTEIVREEYLTINPAIEMDTLPETKYFPQLENPKAFLILCKIFLF